MTGVCTPSDLHVDYGGMGGHETSPGKKRLPCALIMFARLTRIHTPLTRSSLG